MIYHLKYIDWRKIMYCKKCGKKINKKAEVCPFCGASTRENNELNETEIDIESLLHKPYTKEEAIDIYLKQNLLLSLLIFVLSYVGLIIGGIIYFKKSEENSMIKEAYGGNLNFGDLNLVQKLKFCLVVILSTLGLVWPILLFMFL